MKKYIDVGLAAEPGPLLRGSMTQFQSILHIFSKRNKQTNKIQLFMCSLSIVLSCLSVGSFQKQWVGLLVMSLQSNLLLRCRRKRAAWLGRMLSWAVPLGPFQVHKRTDSVNYWQSWLSAVLWPGHNQKGVLQRQGMETSSKACNLNSLQGRKVTFQPALPEYYFILYKHN